MYHLEQALMLKFDVLKAIKAPEHRFAWMVAIAVDAIQIVAMPIFAPGGASPLDVALDLAAGALLTRSLGWHWAFLPTFFVELVPGLDLVPTWTAAVFFVTSQRVRAESSEPDVLPPGPAPARRS
jgi:hypothetical protein